MACDQCLPERGGHKQIGAISPKQTQWAYFFIDCCVTSFWNISELTERPKGTRIHWYLPNGVENVVSRLDSSSERSANTH